MTIAFAVLTCGLVVTVVVLVALVVTLCREIGRAEADCVALVAEVERLHGERGELTALRAKVREQDELIRQQNAELAVAAHVFEKCLRNK